MKQQTKDQSELPTSSAISLVKSKEKRTRQDAIDKEELAEFRRIIREVVRTPEFAAMKQTNHHIRSNLYDHSLKVAFLCYLHHKRHRMSGDVAELVRGALLHDYYLYDPHDGERHPWHWFAHPQRAWINVKRQYPNTSEIQRDMIVHHMFPVTLMPPRTRYGWLICYYDKVAALFDLFGRRDGSNQKQIKIKRKRRQSY